MHQAAHARQNILEFEETIFGKIDGMIHAFLFLYLFFFSSSEKFCISDDEMA